MTEMEGRKPIVFETRHRVRFREIDPYGHMNMVNYLAYFADHRFEGMRTFVAMGMKELEELPIAFHTRSVELEYLRPLFADQEFVIRSHMSEVKRSQCYVDFEMSGVDGTKLATCRMRYGCIDKATQRPGGWPPGLIERFFQ